MKRNKGGLNRGRDGVQLNKSALRAAMSEDEREGANGDRGKLSTYSALQMKLPNEYADKI